MTTTSSDYRRWLAGMQTDAALIETIEINHPSFPAGLPIRLANWDRNVSCKLEDNDVKVFYASRFYLEPAASQDNPNASTTLVMSSYDGQLYDALADLTPADKMESVTITSRLYLSNNFDAGSLVPIYTDSPPVWTLHSVTANWDTVQGDLQTIPLRVRRVGRYYTVQSFPILNYIR